MSIAFLYTFPQWFVFAALLAVIYGWVEDKKNFRLIGIAIFILLALFSIFAIKGGYFEPGKFLTPEQVISEELEEEISNEVPIEAKLFPAYLIFILSGIIALPTLFLDWKEKKYAKLLIVITGLCALAGFFIVVGAVKAI